MRLLIGDTSASEDGAPVISVVFRAAAALLLVGSASCATPSTRTMAPAPCPDVAVVFARGTSQPPGLGRVGDAFVHAVSAALPTRRVEPYGVDYPAGIDQDFAPGTIDIVRYVITLTDRCALTAIILGGYSQGALAVAAAIGADVDGAPERSLPPTLSRRVAAVVVFGDPLGRRGLSLETLDSPFRDHTIDVCGADDDVCGRRGPWPGTHRSYPDNGATARAAGIVIDRFLR